MSAAPAPAKEAAPAKEPALAAASPSPAKKEKSATSASPAKKDESSPKKFSKKETTPQKSKDAAKPADGSSPAAESPKAEPAAQKPARSQSANRSTSQGNASAASKRGPSAHGFPAACSVGPPLNEQVVKMAELKPTERVRLLYAEAKKQKAALKPSASMKSGTIRDPYRRGFPGPQQAPKAVLQRENSQNARSTEISKKIHYDPADTKVASSIVTSKAPASSTWAKSSVPRGTFLFNWTRFPRNTPTADCASSTPGPGTYTSPLFCVGM